MLIGLILVAVGIIALLGALGFITGSVWSYAWPVILIVIGIAFLMGRGRRGCCCGGRSGKDEDKE
jgi:hypothetical protein